MSVQGTGSGNSPPPSPRIRSSKKGKENEQRPQELSVEKIGATFENFANMLSGLTSAGTVPPKKVKPKDKSAACVASIAYASEMMNQVIYDLAYNPKDISTLSSKEKEEYEAKVAASGRLFQSIMDLSKGVPEGKAASSSNLARETPIPFSDVDSTKEAQQVRFQAIQRTLKDAETDSYIYKLPIQTAIDVIFLNIFNQITKKISLSKKASSLFIVFAELIFYSFNDNKVFNKFDIFIEEFEKELSKEKKTICKKELMLLKRLKFFIKCAHFDDIRSLHVICNPDEEMAPLTSEERERATASVITGIHQFSQFFADYFEQATDNLHHLREMLATTRSSKKKSFSIAIQGIFKDEIINEKYAQWLQSLNSFLDIYFIRHSFVQSCLHHLKAVRQQNFTLKADIEKHFSLIQQTLLQLLIDTDECHRFRRCLFSVEEEKTILSDLQWYANIASNYRSHITTYLPLQQTNEEFENAPESDQKRYLQTSITKNYLSTKHSIPQHLIEQSDIRSQDKRKEANRLIAEAIPPSELDQIKKVERPNLLKTAEFKLDLQICAKGLKTLEYLYAIYEEVAPIEERKELTLEESLDLLNDKYTPSLRKKAALKKRREASASKSKNRRKKQAAQKKAEKQTSLVPETAPSSSLKLAATTPQSYLQQFTSFARYLTEALELQASPGAKEALANATYHLQVLGTTLDMLQAPFHALSSNAEQAILYRVVRSSSLFFEQVITALYLKESPNKAVNHYPVALLEALKQWDTFPESLKAYAKAVNYGGVTPRYPHNVQNRFQRHSMDLPLTLQWLLNPCPLADAASLITGPIELIIYLLSEKGKDCTGVAEANVQICQLLMTTKQESKKDSRPLAAEWKPVIEAIDEALGILSRIPSSTNLLDIRFGLEGLKGEIELLVLFPETAYLASHVDPILTRLQFCDELSQETLYPLLFNVEYRTHDLQHYRAVRQYRETPKDEAALAAINIGNWGQYPFQGLRKIQTFNLRNQSHLPIPKAISLRLQSADYACKGEAYDTGFIPVQRNKKDSVMAEKGPLKIQKKLLSLTRRLISMEKACLEQILNEIPAEKEN